MPGMQFEFDESGGSFYYFLVSFYLLVLIPLTYLFWPNTDNKDLLEQNKRKCRCGPCLSKSNFLTSSSPNKRRRKKLLQAVFIVAWAVFLLLAYKVSQIEMEWTEFDPFGELEVSKEATAVEIRKAYKQLSLRFHPDKGGDPKRFIRLTKAYAALTNEQSRKNWQEFGNPDGPGATQFGIALPKWIVDKKNSVFVLGAYVLVFMILLPITVGLWWYRRIKFNGDKILLNTSQFYFYFFNRTPNMPMKRVIMILSSSMEFNKANNSEIVERPSDNEDVPVVLKHFSHEINIKIKEMPFAAVYSVKARALLYSHLHRFSLPPHSLNLDRVIVVKKCPFLINEMINIVAQLVAFGHHDNSINKPRLETIEHCMKLSQIVVQALPENQSPMMQLPHVTEDILRHFVTRKRNVRSIRQLVEMKEEDRRNLLRSLSDDQYHDLIQVCSGMPLITMECRCEVLDEEDPTITPSSLVTVTVKLTRRQMSSLFPQGSASSPLASAGTGKYASSGSLMRPVDNQNDGTLYSIMAASPEAYGSEAPLATPPTQLEDDGHEQASDCDTGKADLDPPVPEHNSPRKKPAVWEKVRKKKGGVSGGKNKSKSKSKAVASSSSTKHQNGKIQCQALSPVAPVEERAVADEVAQGSENEADSVVDGDVDACAPTSESTAGAGAGEDEDNKWQRFQEEARKENSLETKARTTHVVHCPHFPVEKHEWWWVYMADRRTHSLLTAPLQLCSLQDSEDIQLKFTAPALPGHYVYTVCLRSDSYLDFDQYEQIKFTVKEAKKVDYDKQWKMSDDENSEDDASDDSEGADSDRGGEDASHRKKGDSTRRRRLRQSGAGEEDDLSSNTDYDYDD